MVAINVIIRDLKTGCGGDDARRNFSTGRRRYRFPKNLDTKSYAKAKAASTAAAVAAGLVYSNYTNHVAQIQANQNLVCKTLGIICPTIPTLAQYVGSSMPAAESVSETATAILAIALFSVKLKAKYEVLKRTGITVAELTSTFFDYFRTKTNVQADTTAGTAAAAAEDCLRRLKKTVSIDMGDIAEINELLAKLRVDLDAIPN